MSGLSDLLLDEKALIKGMGPSSYATKKVGQVYCYLSSGPIPLIKIGKGKNGRQRMANWLNEYPPSWKEGEVIFVIDKLNDSTSETALHQFFERERVSREQMRNYIGLEDWQKLPDGATEWFHCSRNVKEQFRSVGIDLVSIYKNCAHRDMPSEPNNFFITIRAILMIVNRFCRRLLGLISLGVTAIIAVNLWGTWIPFAIAVLGGLWFSSILFPPKYWPWSKSLI